MPIIYCTVDNCENIRVFVFLSRATISPARVTLLKILSQDAEARSRVDLSHAVCLGAFPFIRRKIFVAYLTSTGCIALLSPVDTYHESIVIQFYMQKEMLYFCFTFILRYC